MVFGTSSVLIASVRRIVDSVYLTGLVQFKLLQLPALDGRLSAGAGQAKGELL